MKTSVYFLLLLSIFFLFFQSCDDKDELNLDIEVTNCIEDEIIRIKAGELKSPPNEVWEWVADGETYYYLTSECCDFFNYLWDDQCHEICAPDGGFSGEGDGRCPNFESAIDKTLVWKDER